MPFNEQEYLQSSQLDHYCLGLLSPDEANEVERLAGEYPVIRAELNRLAHGLATYAIEPIMPSPSLKNQVMTALTQLGEVPVFDLNALPLINAYSDADQWQRTVASMQPPTSYENLFGYELRHDAHVEQLVFWVKQAVEPEEHQDERESFLILEGRCECFVGGELVQLSAGDYIDIPLDLEHTVQVISETPVKAIVQRVKV